MLFISSGRELVLEITDLNHAGEGVGRHDGLVVFVPFALPGERVRAVVEEARKSYLRARLKELLSPSPHRVTPPYPFFGSCGGCSLQHLDYDGQLRFKEKVVENVLLRLGRLGEVRVRGTLGMEEPWGYRCKVRFHVVREGGRPALGLYAPSSHAPGYLAGKGPCLILDRRQNALVRALGDLLQERFSGV
ncbi:class I SAM-dependent RNA methyltransferase [Desulfovirgula thermocuniculi]|uniref:class I SAM-dependent RNA methyltransferase n=1 Tax=Desulfovirgula thermocuniculi TaxID=348842 RepID=UPI000489CD63|nr:TRAM domain-containing protein [Desulfovirgula thermocuniculi]